MTGGVSIPGTERSREAGKKISFGPNEPCDEDDDSVEVNPSEGNASSSSSGDGPAPLTSRLGRPPLIPVKEAVFLDDVDRLLASLTRTG